MYIAMYIPSIYPGQQANSANSDHGCIFHDTILGEIGQANDSNLKQNHHLINNSAYTVEIIAQNLSQPTGMSFVNSDLVLITEKNSGNVVGIHYDSPEKLNKFSLLDVNVANSVERGLLGIATQKPHGRNATYVFLYFTESGGGKDGDDDGLTGIEPLGNRLYRYELAENGSKLINPKMLLDLPSTPGPAHNGGKLLVGPDNNIYLTIGDIFGRRTTAQNYNNGISPDGSGGILRITQEGQPVKGIIGDTYPLSLYYAYGIRNSFGIDFDPLTGKLWDTENGPDYGDEINIVEPGFNSGWKKVQGIWEEEGGKSRDVVNIHDINNNSGKNNQTRSSSNKTVIDNLVDFNGRGNYGMPKLVWNSTVGPTAIKFLNSDKLGKKYENDLFVGDIHRGNLYHFDLNANRTGLDIDQKTSVHNKKGLGFCRLESSILLKILGGITDIQVNQYDGYLYVLSYGKGDVIRIVPNDRNETNINPIEKSQSNASLQQLSNFTITAWFNTASDIPTNSNSFIVNRGGIGSDTPGSNMNYGIWMVGSDRIRVGFESANGTDYFATSPSTYNDGLWHHVAATFNSTMLDLYVDGEKVVSRDTNGSLPDRSGIQPIRIGLNSLNLYPDGQYQYFSGSIFDVNIWNRSLSSKELDALYGSNLLDRSGLVFHSEGLTPRVE